MSELKAVSKLIPSVKRSGDAIVAVIAGEIDLHNSPDLRGDLLRFVEEQKPPKLVLNLAQVPYMDSSAIAVLVEILQKMRKTGGKVWLTNLQPRVQGLIEIARLGTIFAIARDESEALSAKP